MASTSEDNSGQQDTEQAYEKIRSKVEILDVIFHPTENNLIHLGLINGKLKM
jgi:hypothetical protein